MSLCPHCGVASPDQAKFCKACGKPLDSARKPVPCPGCNAPMPPGTRFCRNCGRALATPEPEPAGAPDAAAPASQEPVAHEQPTPQPPTLRKKSHTGLVVALILLVLLVVGGGFYYYKTRLSPDAKFQEAMRYYRGEGVDRDYTRALSLLTPVAETGHPDAAYRVGRIYDKGLGGVKTDDARAADWYRRAADAGSADAQVSLGYMHAHGNGVTRDYAEAVRLYRLAADQGKLGGAQQPGLHVQDGLRRGAGL